MFLGLGAVGLVGLSVVPETGTPTPRAVTAKRPKGSRPARLPIPAAAGTLAAFAASGLFAGLAGLILATTFGHPSHALSGATLFLVYFSGAASQLAMARLPASRVLALGTDFHARRPGTAGGLGATSNPDLALFLVSVVR